MGYPENKKLAKDINEANIGYTDRLANVLTQMSDKMDTANRILEGIAAQEDRYVYRPGSAQEDIVLETQSATNHSGRGWKVVTLPNTFDALYDGEVTIFTSCQWEQAHAMDYYGSYTVKQIYPVESDILIDNLRNGLSATSGSESASKNFSVIKGHRYQIILRLYSSTGSDGTHSSISASVDIRSIVQFLEGNTTKYYYPAEGAPAILSVEGKYDVAGSASTYTEVLQNFFTSQYDGAVLFSCDVSGAEGVFKFTCDNDSYEYTRSEWNGTANDTMLFKVPVKKEKTYSLSIQAWDGLTMTVSNISISAVKTSKFPIIVAFEDVETPIAVNGADATKGYIYKKLPQSVKELSPHYLIATNGGFYPEGENKFKKELVLYDVQNGRADYSLEYYSDSSDRIGYQSSLIDDYYSKPNNYRFYITTIDNEICLVGTGDSSPSTLAPSVPFVTATLF